MKASKFTQAQIAYVLRRAEEGTAIGEVCRKAGISEATFCNRRKKYAGLMPSEMKRMKQPEEENGKLKELVADVSLDRTAPGQVIVNDGRPAAADGQLRHRDAEPARPCPPSAPG